MFAKIYLLMVDFKSLFLDYSIDQGMMKIFKKIIYIFTIIMVIYEFILIYLF